MYMGNFGALGSVGSCIYNGSPGSYDDLAGVRRSTAFRPRLDLPRIISQLLQHMVLLYFLISSSDFLKTPFHLDFSSLAYGTIYQSVRFWIA
jgi:hypothetical protein